MAATEIEVTGVVDARLDTIEEGKTIFEVLANQARERTTSELRTTAVGCMVNAALIAVYHPSLMWLASAFAAASCYGVWGLADRLLAEERDREASDPRVMRFVKALRSVVTVGGSSAALWAVLRFMASALGTWIS